MSCQLRDGNISAVLHHDLRLDLRNACHQIMHFHKLLPVSAIGDSSSVVVVTPANIPPYIDRRFGNTRQESAIGHESSGGSSMALGKIR